MQKHSYKDIKQTLEMDVIDYHESYIKKALLEFGYNSFPESGLNDEGKNKLINKVIEISENEASLKKRKDKRAKYLIKQEKARIKKESSGDLENIVENDLKKVGKIIKKGTAYAVGIPVAFNFALPTLIRKANEKIEKRKTKGDPEFGFETMELFVNPLSMIGWVGNLGGLGYIYSKLYEINPVLALAMGGFQIATNIGSGIYEYIRSARKRAKEK